MNLLFSVIWDALRVPKPEFCIRFFFSYTFWFFAHIHSFHIVWSIADVIQEKFIAIFAMLIWSMECEEIVRNSNSSFENRNARRFDARSLILIIIIIINHLLVVNIFLLSHASCLSGTFLFISFPNKNPVFFLLLLNKTRTDWIITGPLT